MRHGDSCNDRTAKHRKCRPLQTYLRYVDAMDARYGPVKHVYLATDDPNVIAKVDALNANRTRAGRGYEIVYLKMDRGIYGPQPVEILQNTFSDRTHCIAQLRSGSSFLLSALRFLEGAAVPVRPRSK